MIIIRTSVKAADIKNYTDLIEMLQPHGAYARHPARQNRSNLRNCRTDFHAGRIHTLHGIIQLIISFNKVRRRNARLISQNAPARMRDGSKGAGVYVLSRGSGSMGSLRSGSDPARDPGSRGRRIMDHKRTRIRATPLFSVIYPRILGETSGDGSRITDLLDQGNQPP